MMKYLSLPVLLGLCVVVQAKSPQHTVNGITLNDSLAKVQQQLGKPTRQSMTRHAIALLWHVGHLV